MVPEQHIAEFLECFNKDDKIHLRTYNMLYESYKDHKNLRDLISLLIDSEVNVENLSVLFESIRTEEENDKPSSHALFDTTKAIKHNFEGYESQSMASVDLPKRFEPIHDSSVGVNGQPLKKSRVVLGDNVEELNIPGLLLNSGHEDNDLKEVSTKNSVFRAKGNEESATETNVATENHPQTNKKVLSDTVFYQNILPEDKINKSLDISKGRDPYYLFPILQCKLCGLRFPTEHSQSFGQHIEDHRRFTQAISEKPILRREFFTTKDQVKAEKLELEVEGSAEDIVWEKESPNCAVCGIAIRKKWNDALENWVLDDGTKINDQEVAHRKCVY